MTSAPGLVILLQEDCSCFRAGETVSGEVSVALTGQLPVTGIECVLSGTCRVVRPQRKWCSLLHKVSTRGKTQEYDADTFLRKSTTLLGRPGDPYLDLPSSPQGQKNQGDCETKQIDRSFYKGEVHNLQEGSHSFPFTFSLPHSMPGSFHTPRGDVISYEVTAILWSLAISQVQVAKAISVTAVYDLNADVDLLKPVLAYGERELSFACFSNGYLSGELRLARKGAVAGDQISFVCELDNKTAIPVAESFVVLRKQVTRSGQRTKKRHIEDSSRLELGGLDCQNKKKWTDLVLTLPAQMTPGKHWCRTLGVQYSVVLIAKLAHWPKHLEVPVELTIGTVPFSHATVKRYRSQAILDNTPPGGSGHGSPTHKGSPTATRTGTLPQAQVPKRLSTASLKTSSSLSLRRSEAPSAQELVTALQRVRKHARAESIGKHQVLESGNNSRRSSQCGFPPLHEASGTGSRRSTMSKGDENSPHVKRVPRDKTRPPVPVKRRIRVYSDSSNGQNVENIEENEQG